MLLHQKSYISSVCFTVDIGAVAVNAAVTVVFVVSVVTAMLAVITHFFFFPSSVRGQPRASEAVILKTMNLVKVFMTLWLIPG